MFTASPAALAGYGEGFSRCFPMIVCYLPGVSTKNMMDFPIKAVIDFKSTLVFVVTEETCFGECLTTNICGNNHS